MVVNGEQNLSMGILNAQHQNIHGNNMVFIFVQWSSAYSSTQLNIFTV